ncbi:hypothetical protein THIOSC13_1580003 [uncultured Thiomicrorhabdus sp.]
MPSSADCAEIAIELAAMQAIPEDSIDYAVMEKSDKVKVVPCDMGWSDLGSFDALYDEVKTSVQSNAVLARLDNSPAPICVDSNNNLIVARDRQIALVDVHDLLVVDTTDAILVSKKGSSQRSKMSSPKLKSLVRKWPRFIVLLIALGEPTKCWWIPRGIK